MSQTCLARDEDGRCEPTVAEREDEHEGVGHRVGGSKNRQLQRPRVLRVAEHEEGREDETRDDEAEDGARSGEDTRHVATYRIGQIEDDEAERNEEGLPPG